MLVGPPGISGSNGSQPDTATFELQSNPRKSSKESEAKQRNEDDARQATSRNPTTREESKVPPKAKTTILSMFA